MDHQPPDLSETPDLGSTDKPHRARSATHPLLIAVACILALALIVLQRPGLESPAPSAATGEAVVLPANETLDLLGVIYYAMDRAMSSLGGQGAGAQSVVVLDDFARTPSDRLRVAVFAGETMGPQAARDRLEAIMTEAALTPASPEREHILGLARLLDAMYESDGAVPSEEGRATFARDLGWYGKLAAVYGHSDDHPLRQDLNRRASILSVFLGLGGMLIFSAILGGIVLLVIFVAALSHRRIRRAYVPPPDSPIFLETFIMLMGGMILVKGVLVLLESRLGLSESLLAPLVLALQGSLVLVLLWPLVRTTDRAGMMRGMGWHKGAGVLKEVLVGIGGWMAGLPILILSVVIAMGISRLMGLATGQEAGPPPENPMIGVAAGASWWQMLLLLALVVGWAPLVEESIFRGALFAWLRARSAFIIAALASAFVFAAVHRYPVAILPAIMALGMVFAVLREWRGSLIAPMTAHFCQNAMAITVILILTRVGGL